MSELKGKDTMTSLPLTCTKLIPLKYFIVTLENGMPLTTKLE